MPYFRAFQLFWLRLPYLWIQSLLWWISIVSYFDIQVNPCWNRTLTYHFSTSISLNHDWTLGGPRYIHLTKGTNAVFSGFSAPSVTVNHIYELNHFRDELLLLLYIDFSLFANSKILLLLTKWSALSCPLGELQPIVTLCQSEVR